MNNKISDLVSILMPAYNVECYIKEAIESIQSQSHENWELIIIDDGSTDNTVNEVILLAENDKRIKLHRNKTNLNIVKTLNKGIPLCNGEFIMRVDSDDYIGQNRILTLLTALKSDSEIGLIGSSMTSISSEGRIIGKTTFAGKFDTIKRISKYTSPICHIWMTTPKLYQELNGYRDIAGAEDYDFLLRAIDAGYKCENLSNDYSYFVRLGREGNTTSSIGVKQLKLKSYVWDLHIERAKYGSDSFSEEKKEKYISTNAVLQKVHSRSNVYLLKAITNNNLFAKVLYGCLALISPFQLKYLLDRLRMKLILSKENT